MSDAREQEPGKEQPFYRSLLPWLVALLSVAALGFAYVLGTLRAPPPLIPIAPVKPQPIILPPPTAEPPAPVGVLPAEPPVTAPALTRAAQEGPAAGQAAAPHPMPEQLAAASRIAEARRVEVAREETSALAPPPPPTPAYAPTLAPPGRVVQLGAYDRSRVAEAAAQAARLKYSGLLGALPKAVLPYRAAGSKRFYYRVQFIAPNQAQAEVICQQLRPLGQKCKVIY